ncbi:MAG: class I SAM-dependent methyltransferase [Candidatus Tectomicrobia bacterium]|uniref:Class I SAM-dependent methyltransferase n=1 Tax=Tectimicrobiota bacterium TaxID=2528274 RepID=A0A932CLT8_UNCTE|nr:class I SAM-dependent methyltransferase [Candidatus Tectomicrobia bacterium]
MLEKERARRILDLGCGTGKLATDLAGRGYSVIGVDINEAAIRRAQARAAELFRDPWQTRPRFLVGDAITLALNEGSFDAVLLQLVISVIGTEEDRKRVLHRVSALLKPRGILYLSASGISEGVNPKYADLYRNDLPLTGERYSYLSRDPETGRILYLTHHFSQGELEGLLQEDFDMEVLRQEKEASSRRPTEPAYFFYIIARSKPQ